MLKYTNSYKQFDVFNECIGDKNENIELQLK